jgi:uncharacterized protein YecT (DUF1311 family)
LRQIIFALAFVLSACATPSANADVLQSDPDILGACIAQARQDRAALEQCKGLMTRACVEAEGGTNAYTDVLCRSDEMLAWESIAPERTEAIALADPVDGELLAAANDKWQDWREAECNYRAYEYGGGSGEQYDRAVCYVDLTAARAIDLITAR